MQCSVGSKFWHNCKCGPLGPKNAGGRAQCLCWGTARSDRAANHALEPTTCSEHGVPKFDAPEHASEHGLFRSKKMLFLPAPEQKNTVFACSGALFEPCLVLRSICHRNKAIFASHTVHDTQDSSGGAWACKHCTFVNVTARSRCGACSKSRAA